MLSSHLKTAWRTIRRHKGYAFLNIAGLAVGMAACLLILLWVRDELSFDTFHENYADIYLTVPELQGKKYHDNPLALAKTLQRQYPEVKKATRFWSWVIQLRNGEKTFNERGGLVDDDFFAIFSFPLAKGDPRTVFANPDSIVLSERAAAKYFGAEDPIGKSLLRNGKVPMTVTGVMRNVPANSHLQFDYLGSTKFLGERGETSWSWEAWTYVLLDPHADARQFAKKISGFVNEHDKRTDQKIPLHLQPLSRVHLYALNGTDPIFYVYVFLAIAFFILIIACVNFINLATARSSTRAKEIGMRKVAGATRADVARQFIGEALFSSLVAMLAALGMIQLFLPAFNRLAEKQLALNVAGDGSTALLVAGIVLISGLLSGSYPALLLSSFRPAAVLKNGRSSSGAGGRLLRRILVVGQFSAAIILIIATLVMVKQLDFIRSKDTGMDRSHVVAIPMSREIMSKYEPFKKAIRQNPKIIGVTAARRLPLNIGHMNPVFWEGRGPEDYVTMTDECIDYNYFSTLGMRIVQGRSFDKRFPADRENYILNEEALRITGLSAPIGKMFSVWEDKGRIIGIVGNANASPLHRPIEPVVYTMSERHGGLEYIFVKIRPEDIPGTIAYLKRTAAQFAPNDIFEYSFLDEEFNRLYAEDRRSGSIYRYFAILAIFISCLGLFGMAAFTAEQRTREIGIRKVLGASISRIVSMLSREFLLLLIAANAISWPVAYYLMDRLLSDYAYRTPLSVWIFPAAGVATMLVALLTVSFQALRAARANPVDSLRHE
ncbi:MAG: ABC transporter permease [Candidatus Aminicenantes bacterium]|nr:ABC transporter permease [Candidatus Aminicenantes bacterium]